MITDVLQKRCNTLAFNKIIVADREYKEIKALVQEYKQCPDKDNTNQKN